MWKFVDTEPSDAGSIGGDIQIGAAWSRRAVWCDDNGQPKIVSYDRNPNSGALIPVFAVIDDAWYAVDVKANYADHDDADPIVYDVQNQMCTTLCTDLDDVGGSEVWCDYKYDYVNALGFSTLESADAYAKQCATTAQLDVYGDPENWKKN